MSKFAKKEAFNPKVVVANDSRLKKMKESSKVEKKEVATRIASKKESKPTAEKVEGGKRAEVAAKKLKLMTKENPKREGSESFKRYELYRTAKTIGEFLEAGGTMSDIRHDEKAGFIELA